MSTADSASGDRPFGELPLAERYLATCPACGVRAQQGSRQCWFCEYELSVPALPPSGPAQSSLVRAAPLLPAEPLQYSLATLLRLITFIAVCLGVSVAVPWLGIPLSMLAVGGLVRTAFVGRHYRNLGMPFPMEEGVFEFLMSCAIVMGAAGVALVTIILTSLLGLFGAAAIARLPAPAEVLVVLAWSYLILAAVAPLATSGWFLWATRPR